jgi:predicted RNA-binding protein YlqC (UPF0109 family)
VTDLVSFLVRGLVSRPDAVSVHTVEGDASVLIELTVDEADLPRVRGPDGETLRALRTVLSASAGRRKAVLELMENGPGQPDAELDDPVTEEAEPG